MLTINTADIPTRLEQVTDSHWLNKVLGGVYGCDVSSVEITEVVKGVASKVRISARFADDPDNARHFCIKAFLDIDDENKQKQLGQVALREVEFYAKIAPALSMRVPDCPVAVADHDAVSGFMVMEDVIANGGSFCNALSPFTLAQAGDSLDQIAQLHAASHLLQDNPWIDDGLRWMVLADRFPLSWLQGQMDDGRGSGLPEHVLKAELMLEAVQAMASHSKNGPQTLLHGDCHIANVYMTPEGPGFADWQLIKRGNWAIDVAYHLSSVLPSDVAAREEKALIKTYLEALVRHGGQPPDFETAWDDYCRALPYGYYLWSITVLVEKPIIHENFQRLGKAIVRNKVYEKLGLV